MQRYWVLALGLVLLLFSQTGFSSDSQQCSYFNKLDWAVADISDCLQLNSTLNEPECISVCNDTISRSIPCDPDHTNITEKVSYISISCQKIFKQIEEKNKDNESPDGLDLRFENVKAYAMLLNGYCGYPQYNCSPENSTIIKERYDFLVNKIIQQYTSQANASSDITENCRNLVNAAYVSQLFGTRLEYYLRTYFGIAPQSVPFEYEYELAKTCISTCSALNVSEINYGDCWTDKATALAQMMQKNPSEDEINRTKELAEAWENAGNYSNAANEYFRLASMYSVTEPAIFLIWDTSNVTIRLQSFLNATADYDRSSNISARNTAATDALYFSYQINNYDIRNLVLVFAILFLATYGITLCRLLQLRSNNGQYNLAMEAWTNNKLEQLLLIVITLWVGLAFFSKEYLDLVPRILGTMQVDAGIYPLMNNILVETNVYSAFFTVFLVMTVLAIILLSAWMNELTFFSFIPDKLLKQLKISIPPTERQKLYKNSLMTAAITVMLFLLVVIFYFCFSL